jgi:hypothetical protein
MPCGLYELVTSCPDPLFSTRKRSDAFLFSKIQVQLFCDRRSVSQSVLVPGLRPDYYYCQTFAVFLLWTPSLTRGRVCNLLVQLLLGLARAVTLGSKSRRTHDHILLSHLRLLQPLGPGLCIYIPQQQGVLFINKE